MGFILVICRLQPLLRTVLLNHLTSLAILFIVFKHKTAYEMRISDWSSDVCSSDLARRSRPRSRRQIVREDFLESAEHAARRPARQHRDARAPRFGIRECPRLFRFDDDRADRRSRLPLPRSEEHTSELQ